MSGTRLHKRLRTNSVPTLTLMQAHAALAGWRVEDDGFYPRMVVLHAPGTSIASFRFTNADKAWREAYRLLQMEDAK